MADQADGILSPWLRRQRLKAILPYLKGNILDFGCGVGYLADSCRPENYHGIETDPESLATARARHPGFRFSGAIAAQDRFDTIVLLAVIEHLPSPETTLRDLRTVLKVKGRIVLTTPHPFSHQMHHLGALAGLFSREADSQHQSFLNYPRMKMLADNAGLRIETFRYFLGGANQLFVLCAGS